MANAAPIYGTVPRNSSPVLTARVRDSANNLIVQAGVTSIAYTAYLLDTDHPEDLDARTAITGHTAVAVAKASAVFDTLQTGGVWDDDQDSTGYNFKYQVPINVTDCFTTAGRSYLVVFTITPTSGQVVLVRFLVQVNE